MDDKSADERPSVALRMYYLFVGNVASTVLLAATAIFVGRLLGPEGYGLYTVALVVPGYLASVTLLGIPFAATRYPAKYASEGNQKKAVQFLYSMTIVEGLLGVVATALTLPFAGTLASLLNRPSLAYLVPLAVASVTGQLLYNTVTAGFQGLNRMERSALLQVAQAVVKLVVSVGLILAGLRVLGAVGGYTLAYVVSGLGGLVIVVLMNRSLIPGGVLEDMKEAMRYSMPVYFYNLLGGVVPAYLVTLLARYSTNAQIGGFGAAQNLVALISLFIYPISTTLFPLFSGMSGQEGSLKSTYGAAVRYSTIFIVPVAMAMVSLASPLASAVYGRAYSFASGFFAVLVVPYLFAGIGSLAQVPFLNGVGETKKTLVSGAVGSLVTLAAGSLLAPLLAVYGVLASVVVGNVVTFLVAARMVGRKLDSSLELGKVWRIYASSSVVALLVYPLNFLPIYPIFTVIIGGTVFLLLLVPLMVLFRAVNREDMEALESYFGSIGSVAQLFNYLVRYYDIFDKPRNSGD